MSERVIQRKGFKVTIKGTPAAGGTLKDVCCSSCGEVWPAFVNGVAWERGQLECPACGRRCAHRTAPTGGCGAFRYRYMDGWDSATGHCRYEGLLPTQVFDEHGNPHDYHDPDAEAKKAKYGEERREERRQQINSRKRRARGGAPLFFDGGKK